MWPLNGGALNPFKQDGVAAEQNRLQKEQRKAEHQENRVQKEKRKAELLKQELGAEVSYLSKCLEDVEKARREDDEEVGKCLSKIGWRVSSRRSAIGQMREISDKILDQRNSTARHVESLDLQLLAARERADRLESNLQLRSRDLYDAMKTVQEQDKRLKDASAQSHRLLDDAAQAHKKEMDLLRKEMADLKYAHQLGLQQQRDEYQKGLRESRDDSEACIADLMLKQEDQEKKWTSELNELKADLLSRSDDFRPSTDQGLKLKFGEVRRLIEKVTNFEPPADLRLSAEWDPTGFLGRRDISEMRFVLRSAFWKILMDAFFSMPFGFGLLGSHRGRDAMLDIHESWMELYGRAASAAPSKRPDETALAIFEKDVGANKWRSALFHSLFSSHMQGGELPKSQAADYFTANCDHVEEQLRKLLDEATGFAVSQTIARHIPEITQLAANLAIEFGASRAQLCLLAAKPEEHVEVGPCFHHYKDGASRKGAFLTVDLMVSPGLCKIGDGRGDMTARRVLVQSDIYPA